MMDLPSSIIPDKRPAVLIYQVFNLNSLSIIFFIAVIALVEIKFDFTEKMAGDFLKWNNHKRQKLGRMWNVERQNVTAMGQLSELIIEKEEKRKRIETIENFSELFEFLKTDRLIRLTKGQFVKIYSSLPSTIANKIIDPYNLINYFHRSDWVKTFVFQKETGTEIVMVDGQFGVLKSILVSGKDANFLENFGKTIPTSLENLEELSSRIYDVSEFMDAIYKMRHSARDKIIYDPFNFLRWGNSLKRVGISEISEDNLVKIGFEIHTLNKKEVVIVYVDDFLISNLIQHLSGEELVSADDFLQDELTDNL